MGVQRPSAAGRLPVLIVDPNPLALGPLASYVQDHGFEVDVATNCRSAQGAVVRRHYRTLIVVTDLAQTADLECLDKLRRAVTRAWIIVVSMRKYPDPRDVVFRCGADSLLIAPFSVTDLTDRLWAFSWRARPGEVG
jgi:DNA-binding response OmpR family regulator